MPDDLGPRMLPAHGAIDVPDRLKLGHGPEIIDVPVWSCRRFLVMRHTRSDAARPTRTTNVDVESRPDAALPKPTDL